MHLLRSVRLIALVVILVIAGVTSPLYIMLLTAEDDNVSATVDPLVSEAESPGAEEKCLEGKFAIPVPNGSLFWQNALLCGNNLHYWMGEGEPPGQIINKPTQDFN